MSTTLTGLPREVRDRIFAHLIVDQYPIDPGTEHHMYFEDRSRISPQLLCTNKTIHREGTELLYTRNRFDFTTQDSEFVSSFLDGIGRENPKHIRYIRIRFPEFLHLDSVDADDITLNDKSIRVLQKIQSCCADLRTLTMSPPTWLNNLGHPKLDEGLDLVNTRLRAIVSLRKIIVEVYSSSSDHISRKMESLGWTIRTIDTSQIEADLHWSPSDSEDDGPEDDDDYDNDSDFQRRAAN